MPKLHFFIRFYKVTDGNQTFFKWVVRGLMVAIMLWTVKHSMLVYDAYEHVLRKSIFTFRGHTMDTKSPV